MHMPRASRLSCSAARCQIAVSTGQRQKVLEGPKLSLCALWSYGIFHTVPPPSLSLSVSLSIFLSLSLSLPCVANSHFGLFGAVGKITPDVLLDDRCGMVKNNSQPRFARIPWTFPGPSCDQRIDPLGHGLSSLQRSQLETHRVQLG